MLCSREEGHTYCKKAYKVAAPSINPVVSTVKEHKESNSTNSTDKNIAHAGVVIQADGAPDNIFTKNENIPYQQCKGQQDPDPPDSPSQSQV